MPLQGNTLSVVVSRVANGLSVRARGKVANAKVLYSALEAAWEHLYSSHNSIAFGRALIPSKEAFPSHTEEARYSRVSGEGVSSCVFPEAAIPVGIAGEEEEVGWCLCSRLLLWALTQGCLSEQRRKRVGTRRILSLEHTSPRWPPRPRAGRQGGSL